MNKVVFNGCFGGFSLSVAGYREYLNKAGVDYVEVPSNGAFNDGSSFYLNVPNDKILDYELDSGWGAWSNLSEKNQEWINENKLSQHGDIVRHDPALVAVVEEMGDEASGSCAKLKIAEIEGDRYIIDEYEGNEGVSVPDDISWEVI